MKRIVVCSDGTWNTADGKSEGAFRPSNVVKMSHTVAPQAPDGTTQIVFYDEGLGTHWGIDRLTGGAFGKGISKNIADAYRFLVNNYTEGDEIFLFGFSRGAYTVRSTAGLIRKCGLLRKEEASRFQEAYRIYRKRDSTPDTAEAQEFRGNYSRHVRIKFMGVWDTVGALGIPVGGLRSLTRHRHQFHNVELSRQVDYAYQALAIDEKRHPFRPTLWKTGEAPGQTVEQVWFAGCHSDVGGGPPDTSLSDKTLSWMLNKSQQCGLALSAAALDRIDLRRIGELQESKRGLYRFTAAHYREIGREDPLTESVHMSVAERWRLRQDYRPRNLEEYWNRRPEAAPAATEIEA